MIITDAADTWLYLSDKISFTALQIVLIYRTLVCVYGLFVPLPGKNLLRNAIIQGVLFSLCVNVCDHRILAPFLGASAPEIYTLNTPITLLVHLYLLREVMISRYVAMVLVSVGGLFFYFVLHTLVGEQPFIEVFGELGVLIIGVVLLCSDSHRSELRTRHLFWRKFQEDRIAHMASVTSSIPIAEFSTPLEEI
jgi:hypothetical protein